MEAYCHCFAAGITTVATGVQVVTSVASALLGEEADHPLVGKEDLFGIAAAVATD